MPDSSTPLTLWRITHERYGGSAFDGEGARRYGGRFNSPGHAVVYTSGSLSLAILELMANLDLWDPDLLSHYVVLTCTVDPEWIEELPDAALPEDWRAFPHPPETRRLGDAWLERGSSLALSVPSSVVPRERNYLLNPAHPEFIRLQITEPRMLDLDSRLLRSALP